MLRSFLRPAGSGRGVQVRGESAQPDPADVQAVQVATARVQPDVEALRAWCATYLARHARRFAFDLGLVREWARPGGRIVDLGAVPPVLAGAAVSLGGAVVGVDLAPERFGSSFLALGVRPVRCDLETEALPLASECADLVVLHEVFEHLRVDPLHVLREAARILAPGGHLLLSTPNLMSLSGVLNLVLRGRAQTVGTDPWLEYGKLATLGHMGHVREYTTVEVCELLPHLGLRPVQLVFRGRSRGVKGPLCAALPPLRPFFEVIARRE